MTTTVTTGVLESLLLWLDRLCRWLLAFVFLAAALPKTANPAAFAEIIAAYGLLPEVLILPVAVILPMIELGAALALLLGRTEGLWATALMLIIFISVLSYGIRLGLDIDCGCFGPEDAEYQAFSGLRSTLFRDLLLCLPLAYGFWFRASPYFSGRTILRK